MFGIVQGATHRALREESAHAIAQMGFDGIAIGGESIGYNMAATADILDWIVPLIPEDVPHYTMGLGHTPMDIFTVVERGIDMFDCVSPTRMARNGTLFVHPATARAGRLNITRAEFRDDHTPIDPQCDCSVCSAYSRAYLHHLFAAQELLAYRLATVHNLSFFLTAMARIREAIRADALAEYKAQWTQTASA